MAYTNHGHHIPGTDFDDTPRAVARCGGIALCKECNRDAFGVMRASLNVPPLLDPIDHRQPNFD